MKSDIVLAYVPVLHEGYRKFLEQHARHCRVCLLVGDDVAKDFSALKKDIRRLPDDYLRRAIESWGLFPRVWVVDRQNLASLREVVGDHKIYMPAEDISYELAQEYLDGIQLVYESVFLRWDRGQASRQKDVIPDVQQTTEDFAREFMSQAEWQAQKSCDWWRQVGGLIVKDGQILLSAYNQHVPDPRGPYLDGDPRTNFKRGVRVELSTALHVEAALVATAAAEGICLTGADIYVTTFPCPPCARVVAYSALRRLYFRDGYSLLDGQELLRARNVEIIQVIN